MRQLVVYTYVTVDGVAESPEEWQFPYYSKDVEDFNVSQILNADAILIGRKTYEIFVRFWPQKRNNEFGIADKLNSMPKYVVSSTLDDTSWGNSTVIRGDVAAEVAKLKEQAGSYLAVPGSLTLARSLMASELVDEIRLLVHPVVMGSGRRLFESDCPSLRLELRESRAFGSGVVYLAYAPARRHGNAYQEESQ